MIRLESEFGLMKKLSDRFKDATFRQAFAAKTVARRIAHRIRAIREDRDKSQGELAQEIGTSQSVFSRWEKPDYGSYTLKKLQQIANACDVVLWVDFISHAEFRRRIEFENAWQPVPSFDQSSASRAFGGVAFRNTGSIRSGQFARYKTIVTHARVLPIFNIEAAPVEGTSSHAEAARGFAN
jgi:transcriptional regulator with XRE-family HTH domain